MDVTIPMNLLQGFLLGIRAMHNKTMMIRNLIKNDQKIYQKN